MSRKSSLHSLVREIDGRHEKRALAIEYSQAQAIELDIPDGLGVIEVSGTGRLVRIELQLDNLPGTTASALSASLLEGIVAAEEHVQEFRQRALSALNPLTL